MEAAQDELRRAYVNGAPGVRGSGAVWLIAGAVWLRAGIAPAFAVLFVGGMLIMPLGTLIARTVCRAPKAPADNPLNLLGLESTFILFAGIFIAFAMLAAQPQWAFPILAITIGARYFVFRTVYREWLYWPLAAAITAVGALALAGAVVWPINLAVIVGAVEAAFAAGLFMRARRTVASDRTG